MNKNEMRRLFCSTLDQVINKIDVRCSHQNTKLYTAVFTVQPENSIFWDVKMGLSHLDSVDRTSVKAEFDVAKTYNAKFNGGEKTKRQQPNFFLNIVKHLIRYLLYILH